MTDQAVEKLAYSVKEAISATSLSKTTLYELINAGHLKVVKVGGRILIPAENLKTLFNADIDPSWRT